MRAEALGGQQRARGASAGRGCPRGCLSPASSTNFAFTVWAQFIPPSGEGVRPRVVQGLRVGPRQSPAPPRASSKEGGNPRTSHQPGGSGGVHPPRGPPLCPHLRVSVGWSGALPTELVPDCPPRPSIPAVPTPTSITGTAECRRTPGPPGSPNLLLHLLRSFHSLAALGPPTSSASLPNAP